MTSTFNPYAPPRASLEENPANSGKLAWRTGKTLILRRDENGNIGLPHRCVKCNDAAVTPGKKFKLIWHHPAWYILAVINILLYAIVAMIVRKRATVPVGLCQRHLGRHRIGKWVGWVGSLSMLAIAFASAVNGSMVILSFSILGFLLALILGRILGRVLYPTRIDDEYVRMKGCSPAFLDTLPEFPGF